jgi:hypothetical protein
MAPTLDGSRSVTVSITEQLNQNATGEPLNVFRHLCQLEQDAGCAALK